MRCLRWFVTLLSLQKVELLTPSQQTQNVPDVVQRRHVVNHIRPLLEDTARIEQRISDLEAERDQLVAELGGHTDSSVIAEVERTSMAPADAVDRIQDGIFMVCTRRFALVLRNVTNSSRLSMQ